MENKFQEFLQQKNKWMVLLLIGILLLVIAMPVSGEQKQEEQDRTYENQLENILEEMEFVGDVKVMITYRNEDEVEGVVVIADGAENALIIQNITEVVQALFNVELHKIKVMKGN